MKICTKCGINKEDNEYRTIFYKKLQEYHTSKVCKECCYKRSIESGYEQTVERKKKNRLHYLKHKKEYCKIAREKKRFIKKELIDIKGGKCEICGYNKCIEALDFHHKDPDKKEFTISMALAKNKKNIEELKIEINKCLLLCKNCHTELHYNLKYS